MSNFFSGQGGKQKNRVIRKQLQQFLRWFWNKERKIRQHCLKWWETVLLYPCPCTQQRMTHWGCPLVKWREVNSWKEDKKGREEMIEHLDGEQLDKWRLRSLNCAKPEQWVGFSFLKAEVILSNAPASTVGCARLYICNWNCCHEHNLSLLALFLLCFLLKLIKVLSSICPQHSNNFVSCLVDKATNLWIFKSLKNRDVLEK